jgi:hypothetical protein
MSLLFSEKWEKAKKYRIFTVIGGFGCDIMVFSNLNPEKARKTFFNKLNFF